MKNYIRKSLNGFGLGVAFTLIGCGAAKEGVKDVQQRIEEPRLMKTWAGPCQNNVLLKAVSGLGKQRIFYNFSGAGQTEMHKFYKDDCSAAPALTVKYDGSLTLRDEVAPKVRKMDLQFNNAEMTVLNQETKDLLDKLKIGSVAFCDTQAWPLNSPVKLNGKTGDTCPIRKVPVTEFNLFTVEGDNASNLYLGKVGLGTGAEEEKNRPGAVDRKVTFIPSNEKL